MAEKRKRPGPESGSERPSQTPGDGPFPSDPARESDGRRIVPRPGPDSEAFPGERRSDDDRPGSQTGTIGGGGAGAHNPSPERATGVDDGTAAPKG